MPCRQCGGPVGGDGLNARAWVAMAGLVLVGTGVCVALLMPPNNYMEVRTFGDNVRRAVAVIFGSLAFWVLPVYFAAWWLGCYQPAAAAAPRVSGERAGRSAPRAEAESDLLRTLQNQPASAPLPVGLTVDGMREVAAPKTFYLIVGQGPRRGEPLRISTDLFLVGSDAVCQFIDPSLPSQCCAFVTRMRKVFVRDLAGTVPIVVNGEAVETDAEWPVHVGNWVAVGPLAFLVQYRETPLSRKDLEEWAASCLDGAGEREYEGDYDFFRARKTSASEAAKGIIQYLKNRSGEVYGRVRIAWESDDTVTVRFSDEGLVDESEIAMTRSELVACAERPGLRVLLDFKNVRRLSTAGLTMLREVRNQFRLRECTLAACRVPPDLQEIIPVLEAADIPYFANKNRALSAGW
jgi:anti-anti-sigma regulatory factor